MEGIRLTPAAKKRKTNITSKVCIICAVDDSTRKTYGTDNGRTKLREASRTRDDASLLEMLEREEVVYHLDCYKRYCLKAQKLKKKESTVKDTVPEERDDTENLERRRSTRQQQEGDSCIICGNKKYKGDLRLLRICEKERAEKFLLATRYFQDEVFSRTSTYDDVMSVFAADVLYHSACMSNYLMRYSRSTENCESFINNTTIKSGFHKLLDKLDFSQNGYELSELSQFMNSECELGGTITNKQVKTLLIDHFGDDISFAYPRKRSKSQLVFLTKTSVKQTVKKIWTSNPLLEVTNQLASELKNYDFQLEDKYCDENDLECTLSRFDKNRPQFWDAFFKSLMSLSMVPEDTKKKSDTLFQIIYYIFHNGLKKTPFHVCTAQAIHETCKSKTLITSLNHIGLCISYESLQRMNYSFAARAVSLSENNRVPLSPHFARDIPLSASMDNFDHEEDTKSGIGGTHDTVLVLFQEDKQPRNTQQNLNIRSNFVGQRQKKLNDLISCQKLVPFVKPKMRGTISSEFEPCDIPDTSEVCTKAANIDCLWSLARFSASYDFEKDTFTETMTVPSWSAFNSLIVEQHPPKIISASVPILPYPATSQSAIYTTMMNFQDAMVQVNQKCGALWSDEGVYHIAKELQLLFPSDFDNIFLGLGSFHTTKIIINCLGQYLEDSGIVEALIETEIFGPKVVETVLKGKHYSRGVRGMGVIAEALQRIALREFFANTKHNQNKYQSLFAQLNALETSCMEKDHVNARKEMEDAHHLLQDFNEDFKVFIKTGEERSKAFCYWSTFLYKLFPILRDILRADREGNWKLHMSAFQRALPLFFSFGKINYARWGSVYYEDCLKLEESHPNVFESFLRGGFVVQIGEKNFSSVGMDQGLEMCYNKPAKGQGGIIGMTRRKEAVALQDIIKHDTYSVNMLHRRMCGITENDEYVLHHEFSDIITQKDNQCILKMVNFITDRYNPFVLTDQDQVINFATGKHLPESKVDFNLKCIAEGEKEYNNFRDQVFKQKSKQLLHPLSKKKFMKGKTDIRSVDVAKETSTAQRIIEIGRERGYSIDSLLTYELTSTSFFLTKGGELHKTNKSELVHEIEKYLGDTSDQTPPQTTCTIFDFMLHARIIAAAAASSMKTFGELAEMILKRLISLSKEAERVDVVFDLYQENSIKAGERIRRTKKDPVHMTLSSSLTPLPKDMDAFWSSIHNKNQFQKFFQAHVLQNQERLSGVSVFLSGMIGEEPLKVQNGHVIKVPELSSNVEEADERLFIHLNHAINTSNVKSLLIASSDTDVFVCSIYYYHNAFKSSGLKNLWILSGKGHTTRYLPVHDICDVVDNQVIKILPAVHSLSGCDTTSKVGTKHAALMRAKEYAYLLQDFGKEDLSNIMLENAEEYLTRVLSKDFKVMNDLRIFKYHRMKNLDFMKLPPTSSSLKLHIKRAYLQANRWYTLLDDHVNFHDPLLYGYEEQETGLTPQIITKPLPDDFPYPCSCMTCSRPKTCKCRINLLPCSRFCVCGKSNNCKNDSYE